MSFPTPICLLRAAPLAAIALFAGLSPIGSKISRGAPALSQYPPAHLDIKPGSCPNPINVNQADEPLECFEGAMVSVLPVSILGNKFDVEQINLGTISLSRPGFDSDTLVFPIHMKFKDNGTPFEGEQCGCHALHDDGEVDLALKFNKDDVIRAFGLQEEPNGTFVELQIAGTVLGEIEFSARDCVRIINNH